MKIRALREIFVTNPFLAAMFPVLLLQKEVLKALGVGALGTYHTPVPPLSSVACEQPEKREGFPEGPAIEETQF